MPKAQSDFIASMASPPASARPGIMVKINGRYYEGILDSGNTFRSCISKELYDNLPEHFRQLTTDDTETATTADATPLNILGCLKHPLPISIKGASRTFYVNFYVIQGLAMNVNIGFGFMRQYGLTLDGLTETITIGKEQVPLISSIIAPLIGAVLREETPEYPVRLDKPLHLHPEAGAIASCHVDRQHSFCYHQEGILSVNPKVFSTKSVAIPDNLLCSIGGTGKLRLPFTNTLACDTILPKGTIVGKFEPATVASLEEARAELRNHLRAEAAVKGSNEPKTLSKASIIAAVSKSSKKLSDLKISPSSSPSSARDKSEAPKLSREEVSARLRLDRSEAASTPEQKEALLNLCYDFRDIFSWDGRYGCTDLVTHRIPLKPGAEPVKDRWRPLNPTMEAQLYKQIQEWIQNGIIKKCTSEWSSALVPVRKKNGEIRFCLDVRNLNNLTVKDATPIGDVNDLLSRLQHSDTFSTLDNVGAYLAVPIAPQDQTKTAFSTPWGTFCYQRMCFGLTTAPSSYAKLVHSVLFDKDAHLNGCGKLPTGVLPYLDDTIVHCKGFDAHLLLLRKTFEKFRTASLMLSPEKCMLFRKKLKFLGHLVSEKGLETCPEYKKVVADWPLPKTRKAVRIFYGKVSYYRKFIRDFAQISRPLSDKLKDDGVGDNKEFLITPEFKKSFEALKRALLTAPVLSHPDFSKNAGQFILDTDFSLEKCQAGAVLSQIQGGREKVIAYGSIKLNDTQLGYDSYKGELVSMLLFARKFKYFLQPGPFLFRTDCQALLHLSKNMARSPFRQWIEVLSQYEFKVIQRGRRLHSHVDALSKIDHAETDPDVNNFEDDHVMASIAAGRDFDAMVGAVQPQANQLASEAEQFRDAQLADETLKEVIDLLRSNQRPSKERQYSASKDLQFYFQNWNQLFLDELGRLRIRKLLGDKPERLSKVSLLVTPRDSYAPILRGAHHTLGHPGRDKLVDFINKHFLIFNLKKLAELVAAQCETCQKTQKRPKPQKGHYFPMAAGYPFQSISIDFVGTLPEVRGVNALLTLKDTYSRWFEAFPVSNCNTNTVIEKLTTEIFPRFGYPEHVHLDNGSAFASFKFRKFAKDLKIKLTYSPPYSAQSNSVERTHRDLKARIRSALAEAGPDSNKTWLDVLPQVLFQIRTTTNRVTRMSPFEVLFGHAPSTQLSLLFKLPPASRQQLPDDVFDSVHRTQQYASKHIAEFVRRKRCSYQGRLHNYAVGDPVWLFTSKPSTPNSRKFATYWSGPWLISSKINEVIYEIVSHRNWDYQEIHRVAVDRITPYIGDPSDTTLHRVPDSQADLDMKGDEFAEDLERPRRVDEDEDEETAPGPSVTPSGPPLDLPLEDIPHTPGYWLRPNDDEELMPRFFTPNPTLSPEELEEQAEAEAEVEREPLVEEGQLVTPPYSILEEERDSDAEPHAPTTSEPDAQQLSRAASEASSRPPSAASAATSTTPLLPPPAPLARGREALVQREGQEFLQREGGFQPGQRRLAKRPAHLEDFVAAISRPDDEVVRLVLASMGAEREGFEIGGSFYPRVG